MSTASRTMRATPRARSRRSRITSRAAILLVIVVAMLVYAAVPLRLYLQQRAQLHDLRRQERTLQSRNARLGAEAARLNDPAAIELIARECLGMVRPGEIAFVVTREGAPPAAPRC
jgi:cell division protein FtsL